MDHRFWKTGIVVVLVTLTYSLRGQQNSPPQSAAAVPPRQEQQPKNLKVLPQDITRPQLMGVMGGISRSLGVRCGYCHVQGDFARDEKPEKEVARAMLRMVGDLKRNADQYLPGGRAEKLSCWTCHRGSAKIDVQPTPTPRPEGGQQQQGGAGSAPQGETKPPTP